MRVLGRPAEDIAAIRMNRANVLVELPGRYAEAKAELEDGLQIFQNDPAKRARTLGSLADLFSNYAILFRSAHATGTEPEVPRVAELLADPAFRSLGEWLCQRQAGVAEVQAIVNQLLERARQLALKQE